MRRIEYSRCGGLQEFCLADVAELEPTGDQIRVRVRAASVNQVGWKLRAGVLKIITGSRFPRGVGQDFAGVVEAVGPAAKRFQVGDEVFGTMELKEAASFAETRGGRHVQRQRPRRGAAARGKHRRGLPWL